MEALVYNFNLFDIYIQDSSYLRECVVLSLQVLLWYLWPVVLSLYVQSCSYINFLATRGHCYKLERQH